MFYKILDALVSNTTSHWKTRVFATRVRHKSTHHFRFSSSACRHVSVPKVSILWSTSQLCTQDEAFTAMNPFLVNVSVEFALVLRFLYSLTNPVFSTPRARQNKTSAC